MAKVVHGSTGDATRLEADEDWDTGSILVGSIPRSLGYMHISLQLPSSVIAMMLVLHRDLSPAKAGINRRLAEMRTKRPSI